MSPFLSPHRFGEATARLLPLAKVKMKEREFRGLPPRQNGAVITLMFVHLHLSNIVQRIDFFKLINII